MFSKLKKDWVVAWKNNIMWEKVGSSFGYTSNHKSIGTTNGAGAHNVQIFMISPDGVVLHALPGFWHAEDLAPEMDLALRLLALWRDGSRSRAEKDRLFRKWQLADISTHSKYKVIRSRWQGFDRKNEIGRLKQGIARDTFLRDSTGRVIRDRKGRPLVKTLNVLAHERMAKRPFVTVREFDVFEFIDYGRLYYDQNR